MKDQDVILAQQRILKDKERLKRSQVSPEIQELVVTVEIPLRAPYSTAMPVAILQILIHVVQQVLIGQSHWKTPKHDPFSQCAAVSISTDTTTMLC